MGRACAASWVITKTPIAKHRNINYCQLKKTPAKPIETCQKYDGRLVVDVGAVGAPGHEEMRIHGEPLHVFWSNVRDRVRDPEREVVRLDLGEVVDQVHRDPVKGPPNVPKAGRVDGARHPEVPVHLEELVDVRAEVTGEVAEQHDAPLARDGGEHEQREEEEKRGIVCVALEEPPRDNPHVYVGREEAGDFPTVSRPKAGGARARTTERVTKFRKRVLRVPRSLPRDDEATFVYRVRCGALSGSVWRWTNLVDVERKLHRHSGDTSDVPLAVDAREHVVGAWRWSRG